MEAIMLYTIKRIRQSDPAAKSYLEVILTYPGLHVLLWYRIARFFYLVRLQLLAKIIMNIGTFLTRIEIHPGAKIGKGLFIDHGFGVVIGETTIIGNNVTIYQGVTLGGRGNETTTKRHPTLCDGVMIAAGAKVLGDIQIGKDAKIGANAVVLVDVPAGATAVGIPARIILKEDRPSNIDEICSLEETRRRT
jgi:serine O-acetyltransferase